MMKPYLRDREREAKVSTVTGIVLTVAVHVLACLLCVFIFSFFKEMIDTTGFSWKDITIEEADKIKKEQEAAMAKE